MRTESSLYIGSVTQFDAVFYNEYESETSSAADHLMINSSRFVSAKCRAGVPVGKVDGNQMR